MNNTNIENVALKFAILLVLVYNIFRTLATKYMELRLVNSSLVKYSLFCRVLKPNFLEDNLLFQLSYEALDSSTRRVLVVSSSHTVRFPIFIP